MEKGIQSFANRVMARTAGIVLTFMPIEITETANYCEYRFYTSENPLPDASGPITQTFLGCQTRMFSQYTGGFPVTAGWYSDQQAFIIQGTYSIFTCTVRYTREACMGR